jgi:hypothetical protein
MTRRKILAAAAAAVWSTILVAAGVTLRDTQHDSLQPGTESDFDDRWISIKGSRLPLPAPTPFVVTNTPPGDASSVATPPQQLPLATEDDLRQAEAEHHRHRSICPHGRTFFTIEHHQYWRCKL